MRKGLGYEIFMTALVLVIIAGIAGALLGLVNSFTEIDEDQLIADKATAVYDGALDKYAGEEGVEAPIKDEHGEILGVYVPKGEKKEVYVLLVRGYGAYKGSLDLFVNITGGVIEKIAVYEANETPGLGSKALQDKYFAAFYGKKISPEFRGFNLVKGSAAAPDDVSAVTGASKTSTAVTNAVNAAVKWYQIRILRRVNDEK